MTGSKHDSREGHAPLRLVPLHEAARAGRAEVGGKALSLGRMAESGLPVPPGFVVPVSAFSGVRARLGDPGDVGAALREVALPDSWERALVAAARALGPWLAVRSSGVEEDAPDRSWAGQHETVLGVRPEEVPDAVRRCWASLYAPSARAYGDPAGGMAVVVQPVVDATTAGVMFTVDPASASGREMVVEAVWGLGDGLVSGAVAPHWYRVRRPRRLPRLVWRLDTRARLEVVQEGLPPLTERRVLRGGRVVREPVPDALVVEPTLSRRALLRLCRLGLRVERLFGAPQDVEWAVDGYGAVRLLQARPITTPRPARRAPEALWTRRFVGERWTEPATPLGWSVVGPLLEWFIAFPDVQARHLGGGPAIRLVHGRPYVNTTVFRRLGFKLPGGAPPQFMAELLPPEEEAAWRARPVVLPDPVVLLDLLRSAVRDRRWERLRCNPLTNDLQWEDFRARLEAEIPELSREPSSPTDAVRLVERQIERVREYVAIHVCSLLFAHLAYQLLEGVLSSWAPDRAARWMERLATCPPGNLTLETNAALRRLARVATPDDLARLEADGTAEGAFGEALAAFLERYGHRSESSWEICAPRWATDPRRLVPLLRAGGDEEPSARAEGQQRAFDEAMAEVRATFGRSRRGRALEALVPYLRRYLLLRENQRFWFDRLLFAMQRTVQRIGDALAERGVIDHRDDVAFLEWPELKALAEGATVDVRPRIAERRARWEADRRVDPPIFLTGDDAVAAPSGRRLQGLGISPGRARGRVRVVRSLEDGSALRPGEILVARAVDPGWTPLLASASGLVLELGGVLSHGAVIAREYGVPAVVNLEGVTRRLTDGQEVTVDGSRGVVWVHDD